MKVFLSCVSSEFRSYRLKLANQLGALKGQPYEVKVQEDFEQGGFTLLDKLADYIRECDLVIHLAGDVCGARPTVEHVRTLFAHLGVPAPEPLPERSYTQWEYELAIRFGRRTFCYVAAREALRDCGPMVAQSEAEATLQAEHRARFEREGKHYETFSGPADLVRRIFYDLGLEAKLKIDNLPYKSLGSLFKGRDDFLAQLRETLGAAEHRGHLKVAAITASATVAAVYGLGGIGKTRAALEYAHHYADEYTALLFVQADSLSDMHQNLASLCGPMVLDLAEKDAKETEVQVAAVLRWLQQHPGWFLILDNVDTEEAATAVQGILTKLSRAGQVVITSRLSNWEGAVETLALDVLGEEAAAEFLLERTEGKRRKQADDAALARMLAVQLGQLALALEQAGAYIVRYRSTFAGYLEEWQKRHERVLEWFDERIMQYPHSVAITWQTSFEHLNEPARHLLRLLSWLAPDPIPESLLESIGGPFAVGSAEDSHYGVPHVIRDGLAELADYSLLKHSDEKLEFSVHRLVQDVTRHTLREDERLPSLNQALRLVNGAFATNVEDLRNWTVLEPLVPHARAVASFADQLGVSDPTSLLMSKVGVLLKEKAQFAEAEQLYRRSLAINESLYGPDHPEVATSLNNLAVLLLATNGLVEAEPMIRRALAIDERTWGPDHPMVAAGLNNLARLLEITNRLAEAESLYRRALEIYARSQGPDLSQVATCVDNLAHLLMVTNRWAEAEPLYRVALVIDERSRGADHPNVAIHLNNLASLLQATDRRAEAEPLYRRALAIDEQSLGENHPSVASLLGNLASLLQQTNRLAEAEPLYRRAVAIDERSYGADHPDVAGKLSKLASLLQEANRFAEAEPLMRRALAINERAYGPDHPEVAAALSNLAQLLRITNQLTEAEPLIRRALVIDEKSYGPDHPSVSINLSILAQLLQETNRLAEAEPLIRRALAIEEKSYGPDHPNVSNRLNSLAYLLGTTNRPLEAEPLMRRALAINERSYGPDHPEVATNLSNLSQLLRATNRVAEAEPLIRRALAIDERAYGPDHSNVAVRLNNLATLLQTTNRLPEAEPLLHRALAISEKSFGGNHPNVGFCLGNLAVLFNSANRFAEAEPLMRRALTIDEKAYGPDHPNVALRLYNLATLLQNTKRLEEAEPLFRRALAIWEQSLGKNHPNVGSCLTNLAQLLSATNRQGEAKLLLFRLLEAKGKVGQAEQLQFAVDLNNYAIDLRRLDRYTEAAAMFQRAIGIEDQYLTTDHPKRAHRRNNLAIIFMLADRLDEALHVNREAWSLKADQHDMTSGRILFIRIALCLLKNAESNQYIGQLRTLIAQPEIPCLGDIARQWNVADILDKLRSRLSPERLDFLATLAVALNEPIKVTDLDGCAYWRSTLAVPLDVPWPDEPERSNRLLPEPA